MNRKFLLFVPLLAILLGCQKNNNNSEPIDDGKIVVHFDACTELETNIIPDQRLNKGDLVEEPAVVTPMDNTQNMKVTGWYQESSYQNKWDFLNDRVEENMTLFAKWADTITINYFLKGSQTPIWTVANAARGEPLELHDELCDGYKFFGYFEDSDCTIPFDLSKPLESATNVYMYRGETVQYSPAAIKRRFGMYAATGTGSIEGNISKVQEDADGTPYVEINFGYSTSADPFMRTTNPQIDVSKSQKIGLKFKNFGKAASVAIYWISKYANGGYSSGANYECEANCVHARLADNERNMSETDEWVDKVIDLSAKTYCGVSGWGNSVTMISMRIQFEYVCEDSHDLTNVVRLASIYGISDDTHVGFKDSEEIREMLHRDSDEEINNAKAGQTQNRGVIFPLNEDCVLEESSTNYMKKDGILLYSTYDTDINKFTFDVSSQNIDASQFSYVTIKMKNLSYVQSLLINVVTISPTTGKSTSNNASVALTTRMSDKDIFTTNLYGKTNIVGIVKSFSINFSVNGVDNAMLLESITLSENQPFQIPGFNFDDAGTAGFVSNETVTLNHNKTLKATVFNVSSNGAVSTHLDYDYDTVAYSYISLKYYMTDAGITAVKVNITYKNGETGSYTFDNLVVDNNLQTITLSLEEEGSISDVSLDFTGAGVIVISEIRFDLDELNSCDLSSVNVFNTFLPDWATPLSYADDKQATLFSAANGYARYYFGYLQKQGKREGANICLDGKQKVYVIYQNQKPSCGLFLNVYVVDKRTNTEYLTAISELAPIMDNAQFDLSMNMDKRSWKVAATTIPAQYCNENYYISNIGFGSSYSADNTFYLRGFVVRQYE